MKGKQWMLPATMGVLLLTLLAGIMIGRFTAPDQQAADASEWLEAPAEDTGGDLKEKNLELLGQVMLLKKMLG
ncbi:MAG: hypothetical protein AAF649_08545, partial [Verrucomicrobiota bacterium]